MIDPGGLFPRILTPIPTLQEAEATTPEEAWEKWGGGDWLCPPGYGYEGSDGYPLVQAYDQEVVELIRRKCGLVTLATAMNLLAENWQVRMDTTIYNHLINFTVDTIDHEHLE